MDIDILIADVITNELGIDPSRVVVYGQNYKSPTDSNLYIVVSTEISKIVGSVNRFDENTLKENKSVSLYSDLNIELTSKNREAYEKKEEVIMALTSTYSIQKQEEYQFKLFRIGSIIDLTFIEGGSNLYRYNIPIRVNYVLIKKTLVDYFDKYRDNQILMERS